MAAGYSKFDVTYATFDGLPLKIEMIIPTALGAPPTGGWPVVLALHGGGWDHGSRLTSNGIKKMYERGYVIASADYRLVDPDPTKPNGIWRVQIYDVKGAVRWLRANAAAYSLNPNAIGVWGISAGGHLAALLGTSAGNATLEGTTGGNAGESSAVQCVIDLSGPTDFDQVTAHLHPDSTVVDAEHPNSIYSKLLGAAIDTVPLLVAEANPITYITGADTTPFLIFHGAEDLTIPTHQSELLHDALTDDGVPSTFIILPDEGHVITPYQDAENGALIDAFFDAYLKGIGGPPASIDRRFPFDEVVLNIEYDPMAEGGPRFDYTTFSSPSGRVQMNMTRDFPLHVYTINYSLLNETLRQWMNSFFILRKAGMRGFLFLEPEDMSYFTDELLGVTDDETDEYLFIKTYTDAEQAYTRRLIKIVPGTVSLTLDDVPLVFDWETGLILGGGTVTIDYQEGKISFSPQLDEGAELKASGQFYLPVRMTVNYYNARHENTSASVRVNSSP